MGLIIILLIILIVYLSYTYEGADGPLKLLKAILLENFLILITISENACYLILVYPTLILDFYLSRYSNYQVKLFHGSITDYVLFLM